MMSNSFLMSFLQCCTASNDTTTTTKPIKFKTISYIDLEKIIKEKLPCTKDISLTTADAVYTLIPYDELYYYINHHDKTDQIKYKPELYDCDDFSTTLSGNVRAWFSTLVASRGVPSQQKMGGPAFGIVHGDIRSKKDPTKSSPHGMNFFVDEKKRLWMVEPQTDVFFVEPLPAKSKVWEIFL
jgi:hypothetical protein